MLDCNQFGRELPMASTLKKEHRLIQKICLRGFRPGPIQTGLYEGVQYVMTSPTHALELYTIYGMKDQGLTFRMVYKTCILSLLLI